MNQKRLIKILLPVLAILVSARVNAAAVFADGKLYGSFKYSGTAAFEGGKVLEVKMDGWGVVVAPELQTWRHTDVLCMDLYSDRPGVELMITLNQENKSYFYYKLKTNWTGWKKLSLPLARFKNSRDASFKEKILSLGISPKGWDLKPDTSAKVYIRSIELTGGDAATKIVPIPVNMAESIIVPFWDKNLVNPGDWTLDADSSENQFNWDSLDFKWRGHMSITGKFDLDCRGYDYLIFCVVCPSGTVMTMSAEGKNGKVETTETVSAETLSKTEFILPLKGLEDIHSICLTLNNPAQSHGYMKWIGLGNSTLMKELDEYIGKMRNLNWDRLVTLPQQGFDFKPGLDIFCGPDQIADIRRAIDGNPEAKKMLEELRKEELQKAAPEQRWREHITGDRRWSRDRDYGQPQLTDCSRAAWAGMLLQDENLLLLAAKRAVILAMVPNWGAGIYSSLPGTAWNHRAFDESGVTMELVFALDFCSDFLTPAGKDYILRRIAEKGIGTINFNVWRWNYIFRCNQLSAFSGARVAAYVAMEKSGWKHVEPYTDLAIRELNESMSQIFSPDGGYSEGPSYYQYTLWGALPAYYCYARARNLKFTDVLPESLRNAGNFAELAVSSDKTQAFIPFNDSGDGVYPSVASFMATMLPESQFVNAYNQYLRRSGVPKVSEYWAWISGYVEPKKPVAHMPFVLIPSMGSMASFRELDGCPLKIALIADTKKDAHKHKDAGEFTIELAGETLAMDSGGVKTYASTFTAEMQDAARHNVMVPVLGDGGFGDQKLIRDPIRLETQGDRDGFSAKVDLLPCWEIFFDRRVRKMSSQSVKRLMIEDEWKLKKGQAQGVAFLWLTSLPVEVKDRIAYIRGGRAMASFKIPDGWTCHIDKLKRDGKSDQNRLVLLNTGEQGCLKLEVDFSVLPETEEK